MREWKVGVHFVNLFSRYLRGNSKIGVWVLVGLGLDLELAILEVILVIEGGR
jgi:hypothetical protein